jgi:hypothetical protein
MFCPAIFCILLLQSEGHQPPAMAGHSMTLTENDRIWVIGGFSPVNYFIESIYVLDLGDGSVVWTEVVNHAGTKPVGKYRFFLTVTKIEYQF